MQSFRFQQCGSLRRGFGGEHGSIDRESIGTPGFRIGHPQDFKLLKWRRVNPIGVCDQQTFRRACHACLQMETAVHFHPDHAIAETGNDCFQLADPLPVRAARYADKQRLSDSQHIAALDGSWRSDSVNRTNASDVLRDFVGLGFAACRTQSAKNRNLIEHDHRIFHERRVGQLRLLRQNRYRDSRRLQRRDIRRMLLPPPIRDRISAASHAAVRNSRASG